MKCEALYNKVQLTQLSERKRSINIKNVNDLFSVNVFRIDEKIY
jgi:hypothetical protein